MISCNIWLPVVIHRSKTCNNALDVFWSIETIIMPLSRQPQKKSFCPVSHSLAPTFMKIFFIMRLPCKILLIIIPNLVLSLLQQLLQNQRCLRLCTIVNPLKKKAAQSAFFRIFLNLMHSLLFIGAAEGRRTIYFIVIIPNLALSLLQQLLQNQQCLRLPGS